MQQKLFRCSASVVEQANGYYTVTTHVRFEHGGDTEITKYPNLSWAEVSDLVLAVFEEWSTSRQTHFKKVVGLPWVQMSLLPDA